jgi:N-acetylmuramoyl-L-alanine amidase
MKICIDAGHGGKDPGAVTTSGGVAIREKDLNMSLAEALRILLEKNHEVFLTRHADKDVYLAPYSRIWMAEKWGADILISLHCNASDNPAAHGMEVLYRDEENDLLLAQPILAALLEAVPELQSRGVKDDEEDLGRKLAVLGNFLLPACLVEVGFITNEGDLDAIQRFEDVAGGIAEGVRRYCEFIENRDRPIV